MSLERAAALEARAHDVLATLRLLERWSAFGEPHTVGALACGLMTAPDIDVEVYVDEPRIEIGFAVMRELALLRGVVEGPFLERAGRP